MNLTFRRRPSRRKPDSLVLLAFLLAARTAFSGPPYFTDDPQPVDYRHWEFYVAATRVSDGRDVTGDAPHVEVNYGAVPELQLHLVVPLSYSRPAERTDAYGFGDVEIGAKFRFVQETHGRPQVGVFPLVELPAGDASRGLGAGHTRLFIPIWLQKSFGKWTTYGGGGYWINPGEGNQNWWFAGWQIQVQASPFFAPGVELFYQTPSAPPSLAPGTPSEIGRSAEIHFNVGFVLDFGENHHLLFSAGRAFYGCNCDHIYVAYLLTIGAKP